MIRIVTLSNKPDLLVECKASVEKQTRRDFMHIVQADEGRDWGECYPPAVFMNEQFRLAPAEDYLCWLSDDDLLETTYLEVLAGYLDAHPEAGCCYCGAIRKLKHPKRGEWEYSRYPATEVWRSTHLPGGHIDGGQVLLRRTILEKMSYPYVPEITPGMSNFSDGFFMDRLALVCDVVPVPGWLLILRTTPCSAHMICNENLGIQSMNWLRLRKPSV